MDGKKTAIYTRDKSIKRTVFPSCWKIQFSVWCFTAQLMASEFGKCHHHIRHQDATRTRQKQGDGQATPPLEAGPSAWMDGFVTEKDERLTWRC